MVILAFVLILTLVLCALFGRSLGELGRRDFRWAPLACLCFVGQFVATMLPVSTDWFGQARVGIIVGTQVLVIAIVGANWQHHGMGLIGAGLLMNVAVMLLNGGLMPITPELYQTVRPTADLSTQPIGAPIWASKNVLLLRESTVLWELSDRFLWPWLPFKAAFSLGDVAIAVGAARLIWRSSKPASPSPDRSTSRTAAAG